MTRWVGWSSTPATFEIAGVTVTAAGDERHSGGFQVDLRFSSDQLDPDSRRPWYEFAREPHVDMADGRSITIRAGSDEELTCRSTKYTVPALTLQLIVTGTRDTARLHLVCGDEAVELGPAQPA